METSTTCVGNPVDAVLNAEGKNCCRGLNSAVDEHMLEWKYVGP